ncbi:MAG: trimethylamine methyltransferase family protein [Gaiellales bacterium]
MLEHRYPYLEPVTPDGLDTIERGWQRIVSELGIRFDHPEALRRFAEAGQAVDGDIVRFDPDWVLELCAKAPSEFTLHARNPERDMRIGGDHMVFLPVQGPPFVLRDGVRGEGTLADFRDLLRLAQSIDVFDSAGSLPLEPNDVPIDSRHLDELRSLVELTDKPFGGHSVSVDCANDALAVARIVFGDRVEHEACTYTNINVNSPLVYDERMLDALLIYAGAGQPVLVVPFLLMGAMAPASVPAALAQQFAEALTGIALIQLVNPGAPCVLGSFLSTTDLKNGSPAFGGPESHFGLLASGQLARRYGLPWRAGGGALTTSPAPDAQAAWEGMNTMQASFLAGANWHMHCGGWLEGGLVASFEKLIIDVDMLRVLIAEFTPIEIDEESLAFGAHDEVRHGGHFLGAAHTMERFRDCFHRPELATTENFQRWSANGSLDAAQRATAIWRRTLDEYEQPPLDDAVRAELDEFVVRRRTELGD